MANWREFQGCSQLFIIDKCIWYPCHLFLSTWQSSKYWEIKFKSYRTIFAQYKHSFYYGSHSSCPVPLHNFLWWESYRPAASRISNTTLRSKWIHTCILCKKSNIKFEKHTSKTLLVKQLKHVINTYKWTLE